MGSQEEKINGSWQDYPKGFNVWQMFEPLDNRDCIGVELGFSIARRRESGRHAGPGRYLAGTGLPDRRRTRPAGWW